MHDLHGEKERERLREQERGEERGERQIMEGRSKRKGKAEGRKSMTRDVHSHSLCACVFVSVCSTFKD